MKQTGHAVALAACVFDMSGGSAPAEVRLVPAGVFRARDGRPEGLPGWRIDGEIARRAIARMSALESAIVIDYEHQTLHAEENGRPAPAAGWFRGGNVEWREGDGLYATGVEWTEAAKARIAAGEYRYLSPVIGYDRGTGEVLSVVMAALTNYPAIDGLGDLVSLAASLFGIASASKEVPMKDRLIALLGLAAGAADERIEAAVAALKAKAEASEAKDAEIAALKAAAPDPAKYVPVGVFEAMKADVARLKADRTAAEADALVRAGFDAGKLVPAQEAWARDLGAKDIAALKAYIESTPAIAALVSMQTGGQAPGDGAGGGLSAAETAVCKAMGLDPEAYKKHREVA